MLGTDEKDFKKTSVAARLRMAGLNAVLNTPRATATILGLMVAVLLLTVWRCSGCPEPSCTRATLQPAAVGPLAPTAASAGALQPRGG